MENRSRQDFKGATGKKSLSEVSDAEIVTSDAGISELFNKSTGNLCHSLSSNSVVKSQNTRLTLRAAWRGTTSLCRIVLTQLCLKERHTCSWLLPPTGCPRLTNPILAWLKRAPLMHFSSLTCFCSPFSTCCMQSFTYIYVCEADYLFGSCERNFFFITCSVISGRYN